MELPHRVSETRPRTHATNPGHRAFLLVDLERLTTATEQRERAEGGGYRGMEDGTCASKPSVGPTQSC
jgi:hypothetical protein